MPLHGEWNLLFESVHDIADHRAPAIPIQRGSWNTHR